VGRPDIPVGVGRDTPLEGSNAFPDAWRQGSDEFWGVELPEGEVTGEALPAAELIVQIVAQSAQPVTVFVSGNHTNLAEALRLDPGIAGNISEVQIMGGSLYVDGNIKSEWPSIDNSAAEWNIWVDPLAAQEVFNSGVTVHMTPLDATNQVMWRKADAANWAKATSPAGKLAGKMLDWMLRSWSSGGVYIWDLSAAINASDPALCAQSALGVEVLTAPGPEQGRTAVMERAPNVVACLEPDAEKFKALAAAVFGR
jgi:pyrimidine-specific ribonucleoside hydrolase